MTRHYQYISFDQLTQDTVYSFRKLLLVRIISKIICVSLAIAAVLAIGSAYNVFADSPAKNIHNTSFTVILVVLAGLTLLLLFQVYALIQANSLEASDIVDAIENTKKHLLYTIKLNHGIIVRTTPLSDINITHAQLLLNQLKAEHSQLTDDLFLKLKNGIHSSNKIISAEYTIRVEIILDQLTAGNEKILESIEEYYMPFPSKNHK